ncbi:hypothetical protein ACX40Y_00340 [Sphingomonas sp. RS6]
MVGDSPEGLTTVDTSDLAARLDLASHIQSALAICDDIGEGQVACHLQLALDTLLDRYELPTSGEGESHGLSPDGRDGL